MNKLLVVYNTCGIRGDNIDWYIECIHSFLNQNFEDYKVVLSSCLNSMEGLQRVEKTFSDNIGYCVHSQPYTVNITFNKTVQECVKKYGEFEGYVYIDSGCSFENQSDILRRLYDSFTSEADIKNGIVYLQVDTDEALQVLGDNFKYESSEIQIKDKNLTVPIGKGINLHVSLFSHDIYKEYGNIIPDVFAAYCTESVFSFLAASVNSKWIIMADKQVRHLKSIDGATLCVPHHSPVYHNGWNNLFCGRNVLDFVKDKDAHSAGLGYEECENIMTHSPAAYANGLPLYPEKLKYYIKKYFFLTEKELDYNSMQSTLYTKLTYSEDN